MDFLSKEICLCNGARQSRQALLHKEASFPEPYSVAIIMRLMLGKVLS